MTERRTSAQGDVPDLADVDLLAAERRAGVLVDQVAPGVTWLLRQEVLRPHQRVQDMDSPGDDDATTAHFAAYDVTGADRALDEVVGVVTVLLAPESVGVSGAPDAVDPPPPGGLEWQLRFLAVAPTARGRGVGRLLVERVVDHVARQGGGALWANARTAALGLYVRHGWTAVSEVFERPSGGPHVRVRRPVPARR